MQLERQEIISEYEKRIAEMDADMLELKEFRTVKVCVGGEALLTPAAAS